MATSSDLQTFLDNLALAPTSPERDENMPFVETTRGVIEYYNREPGMMASFDKAGYFIFQGVKVYKQGKSVKVEG